jgi:hypothetical protein
VTKKLRDKEKRDKEAGKWINKTAMRIIEMEKHRDGETER